MGLRICLFIIFAFTIRISGYKFKHVRLVVDTSRVVAETDDNFVCATIDWWPHDKCNYNQCPWGNASLINLDLSQPILAKAIQAFEGLRIRIGGSLQDQVIYDVGSLKSPCKPFRKTKGGLFGFSKGCLRMNRWDELNRFLNKTRAIVTFGLNALNGRREIKKEVWGGAWDSSNARDFMNYTLSKKYSIHSWEFGNELSGSGVSASVDAEVYGNDLIKLKDVIDNVYKNTPSKPLVVAPGGFFSKEWFEKFLHVSGSGVLDIMSHHIYNLGPGDDPNLPKKILDPKYLDEISITFKDLNQTLEKNGPWASAWVGESGGAYNSGGRSVSNTFTNSFWYLDQLGMSSKYDTKVYCRQSLIGGNYGLLDTSTFIPNPDYYGALLWNQLMGKRVLAIESHASSFLRSYAHCSKGRSGITLLVINLSDRTDFTISLHRNNNIGLRLKHKTTQKTSPFVSGLKSSVSWLGEIASDGSLLREEYHLTTKHKNMQTRTVFLNGIPLQLTDEGNIPTMEPLRLDASSPLYVGPLSISFVSFPSFDAPACL